MAIIRNTLYIYWIFSVYGAWHSPYTFTTMIRNQVFHIITRQLHGESILYPSTWNVLGSSMGWGSLWSWMYGSWIYNYLCNQCLSPYTLLARISLRRGVLDTTLCDKVCQWLVFSWYFRFPPPITRTPTEILLKEVLNIINITLWIGSVTQLPAIQTGI